MALSKKIDNTIKRYTFYSGQDIAFGTILLELIESDYPVVINNSSEEELCKKLDDLVSFWLEKEYIKLINI